MKIKIRIYITFILGIVCSGLIFGQVDSGYVHITRFVLINSLVSKTLEKQVTFSGFKTLVYRCFYFKKRKEYKASIY